MRVMAVLAVLAALLLCVAAPASAQAVLESTQPSDGARLDAAPEEVSVRFDAVVEPAAQPLRVYGRDGARADLADAVLAEDGSAVRVSLREGLRDGVYTATWRVLGDGEPLDGAFVFTVGEPSLWRAPTADEVLGDASNGAGALAAITRWIVYGGTLLAAGGVVFLLLVHDGRSDERAPMARAVTIAALAAGIATAVSIPLQAVVLTAGAWAAATDGSILAQIATGPFGLGAFVRLAALTALMAGTAWLERPWARGLAGAAAAGALASFLLTGHAVNTEPRLVFLAANAAHLAAGAVWFGGLVLLGMALRARSAEEQPVSSAEMIARFSTIALLAVAAVAAGGIALGWVQTAGAARAVAATAYGWVLLAKTAVVAGVVAVAAYNNRRLVPAITRAVDARRAWGRLRRTVRLEVVGIVAVLAVTALLVNLTPARTAAGIGEVATAYAELGPDHQIHVVVDPAEPGRNEIHVYMLDSVGMPADDVADEVRLRLSLPGQQIAEITREPLVAGPGHFVHVGPEMTLRGQWQIEVVVVDGEADGSRATLDVGVGVPR